MTVASNTNPLRRRILVVDDHADSAEGLAFLLRLHGHDAQTAEDGIVALDMVGTFQPDVVVLDIGLPRMNGFDVARRLRDGNASLLLVALTGHGKDEDRRRAGEAGFDHLLVKPILVETLEAVLAAPRTLQRFESNVH